MFVRCEMLLIKMRQVPFPEPGRKVFPVPGYVWGRCTLCRGYVCVCGALASVEGVCHVPRRLYLSVLRILVRQVHYLYMADAERYDLSAFAMLYRYTSAANAHWLRCIVHRTLVLILSKALFGLDFSVRPCARTTMYTTVCMHYL